MRISGWGEALRICAGDRSQYYSYTQVRYGREAEDVAGWPYTCALRKYAIPSGISIRHRIPRAPVLPRQCSPIVPKATLVVPRAVLRKSPSQSCCSTRTPGLAATAAAATVEPAADRRSARARFLLSGLAGRPSARQEGPTLRRETEEASILNFVFSIVNMVTAARQRGGQEAGKGDSSTGVGAYTSPLFCFRLT